MGQGQRNGRGLILDWTGSQQSDGDLKNLTIPDSIYLNFFINLLLGEFDMLISTVNYELDTVEEVVSNLCQVEMK